MLEWLRADLPVFLTLEWVALLLIFCWSGFVRSGLGFGGAALALPLLLLIAADPTLWLPVIGFHLLFFSLLTLRKSWSLVNWRFIFRSMRWIILPKMLAIFGLVSLPAFWTAVIVYSLALFYGIQWVRNVTIESHSPWKDRFLLACGGYASGMALSGAPILVTVYARHVNRLHLRNTLFALWIVLVTFKMMSFVFFEVPLQWALALVTFPAVGIGHYWGLRFHDKLVQDEHKTRLIMGSAIALICIIGLVGLFI